MKPIQIEFKPSIILSTLIILLSSSAISILVLLSLAWQIKCVLVALILISACYAVLQQGLLLMPNSIVGLSINSKNELYLRYKDGQEDEVSVNGSTVVTAYLVVISFCRQNVAILNRLFPQHIVILNDKIDEERFRQLRVWLRWGMTNKIKEIL